MDCFSSASEPTFLFSTPGIDASISVLSFSAYEWISHYFAVNIAVSASSYVDPSQGFTDKDAILTIVHNPEANDRRFFHGIISEAEHVATCDGRYIYEVQLVPSLWRLTLRKNCRIFQEMHTQEIITQILQEGGISSEGFRLALMNQDRLRGFCVQYRETDFDFISRLMEEEGIFYFFEHSEDKHVMIISDDRFIHAPIGGDGTIPFNVSGMAADRDCVTAFSFSHRLRPAAFAHRNFNFKRPSVDLTSRSGATGQEHFEIYDYPALHMTEERGKKLAKVRMEELTAQQSQGHGQTSCCRFLPGYTFTLADHQTEALNMEYLIVNIMHAGFQPQSLEEMSGGEFSYSTEFTVIPASTPYRPAMTVQKPSISGLQSAIVVGPPGQEIYTDEYGRVRVRFHWDRDGRNDGKSSCWLRISQPWSGSRWGMIAIPRVGDEVLVAFLDGDPDRPIIVGSLNNADSPAVYPLPLNQTQTGIRTQSTPNGGRDNYNEIRFEDKKGSEHIFLQGERDWNILIKNDKGQVIGHDETLLVRNDRKKTVEMNQSESIGRNKSIKVACDHDEIIGANMRASIGIDKTENVGANASESVGLAKNVTVGAAYQVSVGGVMNETVGGAKTEEVGLAKAVAVGADMTETVAGLRQMQVGTRLEIKAGESFQICCGKSTLRMESDGSIFINSTQIDLAASGVMKATAEDIQLN